MFFFFVYGELVVCWVDGGVFLDGFVVEISCYGLVVYVIEWNWNKIFMCVSIILINNCCIVFKLWYNCKSKI